jgi:hypothetical protein
VLELHESCAAALQLVCNKEPSKRTECKIRLADLDKAANALQDTARAVQRLQKQPASCTLDV